jgi:anthranilate phosphoribosyltransferase
MFNEVTINNLALAIIALSNLVMGILAYYTHKNMQMLEKNTNSIKDALIVTTAVASRAEGVAAERKAGDKRAADLLKNGDK